MHILIVTMVRLAALTTAPIPASRATIATTSPAAVCGDPLVVPAPAAVTDCPVAEADAEVSPPQEVEEEAEGAPQLSPRHPLHS